MTDDLRVEDFIRLACEDSMPAVATLGRVSLVLLAEKKTAERRAEELEQDLRPYVSMLEAAERERDDAERLLALQMVELPTTEERIPAAELYERWLIVKAERDDALERVERTEAALGTLLASIRAQRLGAHFGASLDWAYAALEGREGKPS